MEFHQDILTAPDGQILSTYHWIVPEAKGAILIAHGWSEHAMRYAKLAEWLYDRGYEVFALDHRGHGHSAGKRGHVNMWMDYVRDLEMARCQLKHPKRYLLGHSMGGMISVLHAIAYPERFNAIALSGPATDLSIQVPRLKYWASQSLSSLWPTLALANKIDASIVCSDPKVVESYVNDPLNHGVVSVRWFIQYLSTIERVRRESRCIKTPVGIWHGDQDELVKPWVSKALYESLRASKSRHRRLVKGAYHEILYEPNWKKTAAEMTAWLSRF